MNIPQDNVLKSYSDLRTPMDGPQCVRDISPLENVMDSLVKSVMHNIDLVERLDTVVSQPAPMNDCCNVSARPTPITLYQKLFELAEIVSSNNGKLQELIDRLKLEIGDIKLI